ncbi:MAG TPA: GGDEF domain-containing protein [Acidobacteriota bacterium]
MSDSNSGEYTTGVGSLEFDPGPQQLILVGLTGPGAGVELVLSRAVSILGRGNDATLVLKDAKISRRHLKVTVVPHPDHATDRTVLIQDLGSTNGVRVDGERIKERILRGGEKILIGNTVLRFERRDAFDAAYYDRLQQMALTDPLTGAGNRFAMAQELERQEAIRARYGRSYSLLLVDIDHFKAINDRIGHELGDRVLREVVSQILAQLREADRVFRYGGDEFLVVLVETDESGAALVAERIRASLESHVFSHRQGVPLRVSASIGVAEARDDKTMDYTDGALYQAKRGGRNCVRVASDQRPTSGAEPFSPRGKTQIIQPPVPDPKS